jgi:hypothetical protein
MPKKLNEPSNPLNEADVRLARAIMLDAYGMEPNTLMIGAEAAKKLGFEPGVYTRNTDGTVSYCTFEEWERQS